MKKDIIPKVLHDKQYLEKNNIKIFFDSLFYLLINITYPESFLYENSWDTKDIDIKTSFMAFLITYSYIPAIAAFLKKLLPADQIIQNGNFKALLFNDKLIDAIRNPIDHPYSYSSFILNIFLYKNEIFLQLKKEENRLKILQYAAQNTNLWFSPVIFALYNSKLNVDALRGGIDLSIEKYAIAASRVDATQNPMINWSKNIEHWVDIFKLIQDTMSLNPETMASLYKEKFLKNIDNATVQVEDEFKSWSKDVFRWEEIIKILTEAEQPDFPALKEFAKEYKKLFFETILSPQPEHLKTIQDSIRVVNADKNIDILTSTLAIFLSPDLGFPCDPGSVYLVLDRYWNELLDFNLTKNHNTKEDHFFTFKDVLLSKITPLSTQKETTFFEHNLYNLKDAISSIYQQTDLETKIDSYYKEYYKEQVATPKTEDNPPQTTPSP